MNPVILVAIGGALGSVGRYWLALAVARAAGAAFPWGTVLINILGSFLIGWFAAFSGPGTRIAAPETARLFVMTGICGGFTTFSAFSLQTIELLRLGHLGRALANVLASVILCLLATALGMRLG